MICDFELRKISILSLRGYFPETMNSTYKRVVFTICGLSNPQMG